MQTKLDLNGTSFNSLGGTVIRMQPQAGNNAITFSNPKNHAADLNTITIAPVYQ